MEGEMETVSEDLPEFRHALLLLLKSTGSTPHTMLLWPTVPSHSGFVAIILNLT